MIEKILSLPREVWWKILSYLLSTFLGPVVAVVLFAHYMAEYDFFSYDFFREGVFGMKLFVLTSVLFLLLISACLFGWLILLVGSKNKRKVGWESWLVAWLFLLVGVFIFFSLYRSGVDKFLIVFLVGICAVLAIHITALWCLSAKIQFCTLALVFFSACFLPFLSSSHASSIVGLGLSSFGVGGGIPILIHSSGNRSVSAGELVLATPKYLYLRADGNEKLVTYPLSRVEYFCTSKKVDISTCLYPR